MSPGCPHSVLQSVFEAKGFEELSEETLCSVLASDNLLLDEMDIYGCVRRWANVNAVSQITVCTCYLCLGFFLFFSFLCFFLRSSIEGV